MFGIIFPKSWSTVKKLMLLRSIVLSGNPGSDIVGIGQVGYMKLKS